jgi:hypothetical protein
MKTNLDRVQSGGYFLIRTSCRSSVMTDTYDLRLLTDAHIAVELRLLTDVASQVLRKIKEVLGACGKPLDALSGVHSRG